MLPVGLRKKQQFSFYHRGETVLPITDLNVKLHRKEKWVTHANYWANILEPPKSWDIPWYFSLCAPS